MEIDSQMDCKACIRFSARQVVDGKLTWGSFCTFPVYTFDMPAEPITDDFNCPMDKIKKATV